MNAERKDYFSASLNSTRAGDCGDNSRLASYGQRSPAKYSTRAGDCGNNSRPAAHDKNNHGKYSTRAGDCGSNSRPASYGQNSHGEYSPVSIKATPSRRSAHIALRLQQLQEERAIQQREWQAEMKAIEQERIALKTKYKLLEEEFALRRNARKYHYGFKSETTAVKQDVMLDDETCSHNQKKPNSNGPTVILTKQASSVEKRNLTIQPRQEPLADLWQRSGAQQRSIRAYSKSLQRESNLTIDFSSIDDVNNVTTDGEFEATKQIATVDTAAVACLRARESDAKDKRFQYAMNRSRESHHSVGHINDQHREIIREFVRKKHTSTTVPLFSCSKCLFVCYPSLDIDDIRKRGMTHIYQAMRIRIQLVYTGQSTKELVQLAVKCQICLLIVVYNRYTNKLAVMFPDLQIGPKCHIISKSRNLRSGLPEDAVNWKNIFDELRMNLRYDIHDKDCSRQGLGILHLISYSFKSSAFDVWYYPLTEHQSRMPGELLGPRPDMIRGGPIKMLGGPPPPTDRDNINDLLRAIDSMEEKGRQEDPRYSQLLALRATSKQQYLNASQLHQLCGQPMDYRLLIQEQWSDGTPPQCPTPPARPYSGDPQGRRAPPPGMQQQQPPQPDPTDIPPGKVGPPETGKPAAGAMPSNQSLLVGMTMREQQPPHQQQKGVGQPQQPSSQGPGAGRCPAAHAPAVQPIQKQHRVTTVSKLVSLNLIIISQERENRMATRIALSMEELSNLRALRVLIFQRQLRSEILQCTRRDTTLEAGVTIKRTKHQGLREARRKRRQKQQEYLALVLQHGRDWKDYHRNNVAKLGWLNKAIMNYHVNAKRERKKEQERIEKERMRHLTADDEEGYRKFIDQKKDKRLAFLLSQTAKYISILTTMVKQHKVDWKKKKKKKKDGKEQRKRSRKRMVLKNGHFQHQDTDCEAHDCRVTVYETAFGKMIAGDDAPVLRDLFNYVTSEDEDDDNSDEKKKKKATQSIHRNICTR
ncbi:uncharacterized protein LOC109412129 [Aedes albopictus]|uniref:HSA domain-containing protein n=1 Tax=Aedes albopictus TaxID=7160 RepID=A0ABM1YFZ4_AEDAL